MLVEQHNKQASLFSGRFRVMSLSDFNLKGSNPANLDLFGKSDPKLASTAKISKIREVLVINQLTNQVTTLISKKP